MKLYLPLLLLLFSCNSFAIDVHKWKDSKGKTHYTDQVPLSVKEAKTLVTPKPPPDLKPRKSYVELEAERQKKIEAKKEGNQKLIEQQKSTEKKSEK